MSVLSPARGSHGCSLHLLCQCDLSVSSGSAQTHTHRRGLELSEHSGGQAETDASSQTQMYSDILMLAVFGVDTLDSFALGVCVCVCTLIYMCRNANSSKYASHMSTHENTNTFQAVNLANYKMTSVTAAHKYVHRNIRCIYISSLLPRRRSGFARLAEQVNS